MESHQTRANLFGVDVVRGVAILMVVGYHALGSAWGWWVP
jgi:peptidoglycan/LPS O-acetylase OafA/YrhL